MLSVLFLFTVEIRYDRHAMYRERSVSELSDLFSHFLAYPSAMGASPTSQERGELRSQAIAMLTDTAPGPAITEAQASEVCYKLERADPSHVASLVDELLQFFIQRETLCWREFDAFGLLC